MKVIVFGATGMVGKGVLLECLDSAGVEDVLVVGRNTCGVSHPKLKEKLHTDLSEYASIEDDLKGYDACFFCLGVSSAGLGEEAYTAITCGFTLAAAGTLVRLNPLMTFCFVSGLGTDSSEKGRVMWARVKGKTENALQRLGFKAVYLLRPGYIQPMRGVTSRTAAYRAFYWVLSPLYPALNKLFPDHLTTTEKVGRAMIRAASHGYSQSILSNQDINRLAMLG